METNNLKQKMESSKREKLRKEKPLVYEKIIKFAEREKTGGYTSRIDIGYNYACNLHCKHCMASSFEKKDRSLDLAMMRNISEQADALGLCQFNISGGEPLILPDFDDVLRALQPEKFHIGISTNGYFLTRERAKQLKEIGLDKVMISFDSIDEKLHDENRNRPGSFKKAMAALEAAQAAGLDCIMQHCVSHQNCCTDNTVQLAKFAQENGFSLDLVLAKALGEWEGKHEVLIDGKDAKFLRDLNAQYPAARRDVFPSYGMERGCGAVNGCFHISQYGDVFPCVFMHISIGNVFDEPIKDIIDKGMSIKHFKEYTPVCLAGENRKFIEKYMTKFYGKPKPVDYREVFTAEDFVSEEAAEKYLKY